jgi:hypothetical protein
LWFEISAKTGQARVMDPQCLSRFRRAKTLQLEASLHMEGRKC